jgi:DNA ligase-1
MAGNFIKLYQNHGGTIGYWSAWVEEGGRVFVQYAKTLDGKPVRKEYQAYAKNEGRANATTPFEQGCLEVDSKARLKMDKGYVKTPAEAEAPSTNSLGLLKPMLATPIEKIKPEKIDWDDAFVQPKLDGHRALFTDGVLYSRQGKVLDLPHIVEAIEAAGIEDMHLDGELYIHGKSLQEMSKLIKKHRPESLDIEYHIYDQILDEPFLTRICRLGNSVSHWPASSPLKAVPTHKVESMEQLMEFHAHYREAGYEGTMIRFGKEHYRDGKRSRTLLKMKEFQDEEFCIVGVREGKPYVTDKGTFQVPVWVCCLKDDASKTFTVTAAGTMQEKHDQWVNQDDHLYKFLTVKFHYYSSDGIPQLPIALRFQELV